MTVSRNLVMLIMLWLTFTTRSQRAKMRLARRMRVNLTSRRRRTMRRSFSDEITLLSTTRPRRSKGRMEMRSMKNQNLLAVATGGEGEVSHS